MTIARFGKSLFASMYHYVHAVAAALQKPNYCVCSWHTHGHTRRRKLGLHLQLQDERKGRRQGEKTRV